ncbi:MAG: ACT domain-containing protein [Gammaproteobacteria bacterium]
MATSIVLTIIGDDRPGIVESLSRTLSNHDGNWVQSSMSRMAGQFAGILLATVPDGEVAACLQALERLEQEGLTIITHAISLPPEEAPARTWRLELVGNDHPGIVRDITSVLKQHGVNVEELETEVESASMAGGDLFRARAVLRVPDASDVQALLDGIEDIAQDLMVDMQQQD